LSRKAAKERQKTASMDVMEYVSYLMQVVMRLNDSAEAATHAMPSSACGPLPPSAAASGLASLGGAPVTGSWSSGVSSLSSSTLMLGLLLSGNGRPRVRRPHPSTR
jgi:hypothetical protein